MPKNCSFGVCRNRGISQSQIRFFQFPTSKDADRRQLWVSRCNRKTADGNDWVPDDSTIYIYVCAAHFVTGRPWNEKDHPDYAPSIDVPHCQDPLQTSTLGRYRRTMKRQLKVTPISKQLKTDEYTASQQNTTPVVSTVESVTYHGSSQPVEGMSTHDSTDITTGVSTITAQALSSAGVPVVESLSLVDPSHTFGKVNAYSHTNITVAQTLFLEDVPVDESLSHEDPVCRIDRIFSMTGGPPSTTQTHETEFVDQFDEQLPTFHELKAMAKEISCGCFTLMSETSNIVFAALTDDFCPAVEKSIVIDFNFKAHVSVHGQIVPYNHTVFHGLPHKFDSISRLQILMKTVGSFVICPGVSDEDLLNFYVINKDKILELNKASNTRTLRSENCQLLVENNKLCSSCNSLRKCFLMRSLRHRRKTPQPTNLISSSITNTSLTTPLKLQKLKDLSIKNRGLARQVSTLKKRLNMYNEKSKFSIITEGENLNESTIWQLWS